MQAYLETRQSWKTEDATAAEQFVSNQLGTIRESLDKTEKKLADYRTNTKSVVLDDSARAMIEQIGKYEEQRVAAAARRGCLQRHEARAEGSERPSRGVSDGEGTDTVLQNLASTLAKSRDDLANLEGRFNDASPELREARAQVDNQLGMIRNYVTNRLNRAQQALGTLSGVVQENEDRLKTVPGAELGLAQLARESEVYSKIYSYLLERQQQMAIIKASRVSKNRVLDAPVESYLEDSPNPLIGSPTHDGGDRVRGRRLRPSATDLLRRSPERSGRAEHRRRRRGDDERAPPPEGEERSKRVRRSHLRLCRGVPHAADEPVLCRFGGLVSTKAASSSSRHRPPETGRRPWCSGSRRRSPPIARPS